MGLFDFLKPQIRATGPGGFNFTTQGLDPNAALVRQEGAGGFMKTMPQLKNYGLLDRLKEPDANGAGFGDRALMALLALNGDVGAAIRMRMGLREERREDDEKKRRNEALKAAYDPATGKFDRSRYMQGGGDMSDSLEIERDLAALAPKREVVEGPDGIYERGEQGWSRVMDYPEEPEEPRPAPSGFRWAEDGESLELIPGYAEGIGRVSGVRREAVTSRPMPRQPAAGRRGGLPSNIPPPPPGFRPVQP